MKKSKLPLFIFVDALGWELLRKNPGFLKELTPERKPLDTIFGYSSACDPSIISGMLPYQHRMWSSFYYSPDTCPYAWVKYLRCLPQAVTDYHRVRNKLSQWIKKVHGFTGYFQIYQVPFQHLPLFDYAEKYSIWGDNGLWRGKTIFNQLLDYQVPFYVNDEGIGDPAQFERLGRHVESQDISFAYVLLGKLDAVMHARGTDHEEVQDLLNWYEQQITSVVRQAEKKYQEVPVYIFSDHGMHNVQGGVYLQREIESLGFRFGKDYAAIYDSTMARFWYFNDLVRERMLRKLRELRGVGEIVSDEELRKWGVYFPDHLYGETIFLMKSHQVIAPSFMGRKVIPGMHGYRPEDPDSAAAILSNQPLPQDLKSIEQIFWLMLNETGLSEPDNSHLPGFQWASKLQVCSR